jgi:hypothetical protein
MEKPRGYREKCIAEYGEVCQNCEENVNVVVHHIDHDRTNNDLDNLIPLCATCHGKVHGDPIEEGYLAELQDQLGEPRGPSSVWATKNNRDRVKRFAQRRDLSTMDEALKAILAKAEVTISIEEFVERIEEYSEGSVVQIALQEESEHLSELVFVAHAPADYFEESHGIFEGVDFVEIGGSRYRFFLDLSYDGPQDLSRVTLYASDNIIGMDETRLEDGLEDIEAWVEDKGDLARVDEGDRDE